MRLFAAIELPPDVKELLQQLRCDIAGVRWVPPEQLHLTLAFFGEVEEGLFAALGEALSAISLTRFSIRITGTGVFPHGRSPRVLWAGVESQPALQTLAAQVTSAARSCGIALEDRPFSPHITLARVRQPGAWGLAGFSGRQLRAFPDIQVHEFVLFRSTLTREGAIHEPVRVFPLSAGGGR